MATAMTAPTNGMVLRFISTVTNLIVTVATARIVVAAVDAQQVKSKIAMATVVQKHGSQMAIAMTARMCGMAMLSSSTVTNSIVTAGTAPVAMAVVTQLAHAVLVTIVLL